jgi:transposase
MNEKPHILTERIDDIPLLLAQMDRMGLSGLLDAHCPTHGNWHGLPLGRMATIWLSSILSRGDHRLVHVEPWGAGRQMLLSQVSGEIVRADDLSDDRLEIVLRLLSDDSHWTAFASALNQPLIRVYDLRAERVHVDSTSASTYAGVNDEGRFQFGHSKDQRPDLLQGKGMQAVLDPLGMPLATDVGSGNRADDPLSVPCIERGQASLGRRGLVYVGDCKMASQQTRAWLATQEAYYLCPLPQVQRAEGELATALTALEQGEVALNSV